jgi:hypothetical protein
MSCVQIKTEYNKTQAFDSILTAIFVTRLTNVFNINLICIGYGKARKIISYFNLNNSFSVTI